MLIFFTVSLKYTNIWGRRSYCHGYFIPNFTGSI